MSTELKSERFQIMVEPSVVEMVDDFRFSRRIGSRSEAARRLLMAGLEAETKTTPEDEIGVLASDAAQP